MEETLKKANELQKRVMSHGGRISEPLALLMIAVELRELNSNIKDIYSVLEDSL